MAPGVARDCLDVIEAELRARGVDPREAATWKDPVVRFLFPQGPAFAAAGTSPLLHDAYDALLGAGRWVPRRAVGGTVPIRFPSARDPGDAGWHVDGSYDVDGRWWLNVMSRGRGLLALFLFTDVGKDDAPTELIVGSHLDVSRVLLPFGERGIYFGDVAGQLPATTFERPRALATGQAGDVFLCHPFMVHRATWPHRRRGLRVIAQPEVGIHQPFALQPGPGVCPVEAAILRALGLSS